MFNLHTKRDGNKIEGARKSNVNRKPIIMHRTFQSFRVLNFYDTFGYFSTMYTKVGKGDMTI